MSIGEATAERSLISALGLEESFRPDEPASIEDTGLNTSQVEDLVTKLLLGVGAHSGRGIAEKLCLPYVVLEEVFLGLRTGQAITTKGSAPLGDHLYALTDLGREKARLAVKACAYAGPAPVPLVDYVDSVFAQTIRAEKPKWAHLEKAFSDIHVEPQMISNLGPAINAGKGLFIYGPPGNGKTTIAQRITRCFGQHILIPYAIMDEGQIIKLYDSASHEMVDSESDSILKIVEFDRRWIRIKRPTVVVGGELTMDSLDLKHDLSSNISEASLQLKSNCGCLLIDDFGRQRIDPMELLNRWIIPLESRIDFLKLPSGKKIQVPFEQLIIFSTNLEPHDLADDAFLRRIPYKVEVADPSREEFHVLFEMFSQSVGCEYVADAVDYLIDTHYVAKGRPLRRCQARDLISHILNYCEFQDQPIEMTEENLDRAVELYFTVVSGE